jgi:hypothetical protein
MAGEYFGKNHGQARSFINNITPPHGLLGYTAQKVHIHQARIVKPHGIHRGNPRQRVYRFPSIGITHGIGTAQLAGVYFNGTVGKQDNQRRVIRVALFQQHLRGGIQG